MSFAFMPFKLFKELYAIHTEDNFRAKKVAWMEKLCAKKLFFTLRNEKLDFRQVKNIIHRRHDDQGQESCKGQSVNDRPGYRTPKGNIITSHVKVRVKIR